MAPNQYAKAFVHNQLQSMESLIVLIGFPGKMQGDVSCCSDCECVCALQVTVNIGSKDGSLQLRVDASQVLFAGYLRAWDDFKSGKQGMPVSPNSQLYM